MKTSRVIGDTLTIMVGWAARLLGLLASAPFVLFLIFLGTTICPKLSWSSPQGMPLLCVLAMATLGVLIAWRWEMIGGAIAVVAAVAISLLVYLGSGRSMLAAALMIGVPYFAAGILFEVFYWTTRETEYQQQA